MKEFAIDVDFRVTKRIYVDAENEEQAEQMVKDRLTDNPYPDAMNCDSVADFDIIEVNESNDECKPNGPLAGYSEEFRNAMEYVHQNISAPYLALIKAKIDINYEHHNAPSTGIDGSEIIDLLEEYGDGYDLPEGWWEEECDIDDILLML